MTHICRCTSGEVQRNLHGRPRQRYRTHSRHITTVRTCLMQMVFCFWPKHSTYTTGSEVPSRFSAFSSRASMMCTCTYTEAEIKGRLGHKYLSETMPQCPGVLLSYWIYSTLSA
jgi:hypothetical protein